MSAQLWWWTARAGGIVAWALVTASVVWGLALSTRALGPKPRPNWLLDLHRFLGGAAAVFTAIHVGSLMLDSYVGFGPSEVLVPLASTWHPVAVAWGIVAMYLLAAVEITSLLRTRLSRRAWRMTHFLSFPLFVVGTIHMLSAGTDAGSILLRAAALAATIAVATLTAIRVRQSRSPAPAPRPRITTTPQPIPPIPARSAS
jgi:predicted ferric reductase